MTSIVQDIQTVRSLRKDLSVGKDSVAPTSLLKSVEVIHNCIKGGTDITGWKKVDWRGNNSSKGNNYSSNTGAAGGGGNYHRHNGGYNSGHNSSGHNSGGHNSGGHNGFFNSNRRHVERSDNQSSNAFGNRAKNGRTNEHTASVPLTNNMNNTNNNESSRPVTNTDGFRTVPQKYVSKFKKSSEKVEDTILNTILLGKLNKFSELNYPEIKEFITHIIDSGQTDMMKCFMKLVFEKAASEEMFCPLYAKLISELSAKYPVLLTEMSNLYSVYMKIFQEVSENDAANYNEICKQNVEKKYRRGYSQFLAELIKHDVIDKDVFITTLNTIITQIELNIKNKDAIKLNEEYADCIMKVMKAIQVDADSNVTDDSSDNSSDNDEALEEIKEHPITIIRRTLKDDMYNRVQPLTVRNAEHTGLSTKARFTLLDIYENIQKF
jgi:hypothetical protein